jgi:nucleoside-diphosphate-sugar epimerase
MIGCGDVALRVASLLRGRVRLYGLTLRAADGPKLRAHGIVPLTGDLDDYTTLGRLRTAPYAVLHFAPPPSDGRDDPRTQRLIAALARARIIPRRFVYISTSGVYGDCAGAHVTETHVRRAQTPRAAPCRGRGPAALLGERCGVQLAILRAPGIYAQTRLPLTGSGRERRCLRRRMMSIPITSTPTTSRAQLSRQCSTGGPIAPTTRPTTRR